MEFCAVMNQRFSILMVKIQNYYAVVKEQVCKALQLECPKITPCQLLVSSTIDYWSRLHQRVGFGVAAHWITQYFHMKHWRYC